MDPREIDWQKHAPRLITMGLVLLILLGVAGLGAKTMYTQIQPGEIGIVVNNVTGAIETQKEPGIVYHLPFGMTDVYRIESILQVFKMEGGVGDGGRRRGAPSSSVKVKTKDGGDVTMNLTINYRIDPNQGHTIARKIGATRVPDPRTGDLQDAYKIELMRAYARSLIRDSLGNLSIVQVSDPKTRNSELSEVQRKLNEDLGHWGLIVDAVSATDFAFNNEYEDLIRERKSFDQEMLNQDAAQETARREQETEINSAEREKNVALRKLTGELRKQIIEAEGLAEKEKKLASGEAYRTKIAGDEAFAVAKAEAQAVEAEGLKKAEGILQTSDAFAQGGMTLVLEALARKYQGKIISGKPYNLESNVERLRIEDEEGAAAAIRRTAAKKGGSR